MRFNVIWILIIALFILGLSVPFVSAKPGDTEINNGLRDYAPGEVIVRFKPDISANKIEFREKIKNAHLKVSPLIKIKKNETQMGLSNTELVSLPDTISVDQAILQYYQDPDVLYAEPNYRLYGFSTFPNDPSYNLLWHLDNTGQNRGVIDADIDAPEAWDKTQGSNSVIIAVIDTGIDYRHDDLEENIWQNSDEILNGIDDDRNGYVDDIRGWDFVNNDNDPIDDNGHGTRCAGIIAAQGNNDVGGTGVMWHAQIIPLKILDSQGGGRDIPPGAWATDLVTAISYASNQHADIMSLSLGSYGYNQAIKDAIDDSDALFVCAAGNDGTNNDIDPLYPASYTSNNILSVAATDNRDVRAAFSNYGATSVDVAAPGVSITSTSPGNSYYEGSGTSFATPQVAGLAGLIKTRLPLWTAFQIKDQILYNVDTLPSLQGITVTGGRINAYKALKNIPEIEIDRDSLNFNVYEQESAYQFIDLHNVGGISVQYISSNTYNDEIYRGMIAMDNSEYVIQRVNTSVKPLKPGFYSYSIFIESNDPIHPSIKLPLNITVKPRAILKTSVTNLEFNLNQGDTQEQQFNIINNGSISLNFTIEENIPSGGNIVDYGIVLPHSSLPLVVSIDSKAANLTPGSYDFVLSITTNDPLAGEQKIPLQVIVNSVQLPIANFTANPMTGIAPNIVQFNDLSQGSPTTWDWSFGDGSANSSEQNPNHEYHRPGLYTVNLIITNQVGTDSELKTDFITITRSVIKFLGSNEFPTDPDNDGLFEDLNGNGFADWDDAVVFFWNTDWIQENEPVGNFDFNGNGFADWDDAVVLFSRV